MVKKKKNIPKHRAGGPGSAKDHSDKEERKIITKENAKLKKCHSVSNTAPAWSLSRPWEPAITARSACETHKDKAGLGHNKASSKSSETLLLNSLGETEFMLC